MSTFHVTFYDFLNEKRYFLSIYEPLFLYEIFKKTQYFFFRGTGKCLRHEEPLASTYMLQADDFIVFVNLQRLVQGLMERIRYPRLICNKYPAREVLLHLIKHQASCNNPDCSLDICFVLQCLFSHYRTCMDCNCWDGGVCFFLLQMKNLTKNKKKRKREDNIFFREFRAVGMVDEY